MATNAERNSDFVFANAMRRGAKRGYVAGLWAGALLLIVEMLASMALGDSPLRPFRTIASVVLGREALSSFPLGTAVAVALVVHFFLSGLFGMLYGEIRGAEQTPVSWQRELRRGLAYGAGLWLLNFQLIARILYPWFLDIPQLLQLLLHVGFFGLPLALLCRKEAPRSTVDLAHR